MTPQCVAVSPIDQLQFDPGSIPEASTSDTRAATEDGAAAGAAAGTEGAAAATGTAGAATGVTIAGGDVTGLVTTDVVVVATTGGTTEVVVVVVWLDCSAATLGVAAELDRGVDARAGESWLEAPTAQLAPITRTTAKAVAFQWRRISFGVAPKGRPLRERGAPAAESGHKSLRLSSTMC
jgi:hypothetical protein